MSNIRRFHDEQPDSFAFNKENMKWAKAQIRKYPKGRQQSAVVPLLWKAQKQHEGWLPEPAIRYVADMLDMPTIRVMEIATFYSMFNLAPVGEHFIQLCGTTPCWLNGADDLKKVCKKKIGEQRQVTEDGKLSWLEVECLGACVNAPMVQINDYFYEDLSAESFEKLLDDLISGKETIPGSQNGRTSSEPKNGATTLIDPKLYKPKPARKTPAKKKAAVKKTAGSKKKPTAKKGGK